MTAESDYILYTIDGKVSFTHCNNNQCKENIKELNVNVLILI
jgi:hypothetical protein